MKWIYRNCSCRGKQALGAWVMVLSVTVSVGAQQVGVANLQQRMDSLVRLEWESSAGQWVPTLKDVYTYNSLDQLTQAVKHSHAAGNGWNAYWEENYTYGSGGLITGYLLRKLDSTSFQLKNYWKEEYTYNATGDITHYRVYEWNGSAGQWTDSWKAEYTYDASGHLLTYHDFYWNVAGAQWVNSWKAEYTYTSGQLSQYKDYYWNSGSAQWVSSWKADYTYTAGLLTLYQDYSWNGSSWVNSGKKEYTYTAQGLESTISAYSWKSSSSSWSYLKKEEFSYNAGGHLTLYLIKGPNQSGNQWVNLWKEELTYDISSNLIKVETANWQSPTSQWAGDDKQEYQYDTAYSIPEVILPFWYITNRAFQTFKPTAYQEYGFFNGSWAETSRNTFHYTSLTPAGVGTYTSEGIGVYPNPARDFLFISWPVDKGQGFIELFNMRGQLIWSSQIHEDQGCSLPALGAGPYLYRLTGKGVDARGHLIIQ
ncbi:MAG TPA: T9SS type A sorting domain-containing protein [Bacteroidales bacterium]|nr:T9SS type A sorting domain-containing protein [Bacteroidales bacterium]